MDPEKVEYELQHFQMCTEDIIAEHSVLMKEFIKRSLIDFTEEFIAKHRIPADRAIELRAQCHPTASKMFDDCSEKLEDLSQLYRQTFTIPDNILLPQDLQQRKGYKVEEVKALETKVAELDKQFRQDGVFLARLEDELKMYELLGPCIEEEKRLLELVDKCREEDVVPPEDLSLVQELASVMESVLHT
ncbi:protein MIS12 homolog [Uranotaenia lowii]|uniref:protein MIS12 homolog n=1 Tax=Uranotaenia lowii TaxID=190385 RepID=UPI00247A7DF8|nr:protein MIS12 homolog [Uranotaenia lowii]